MKPRQDPVPLTYEDNSIWCMLDYSYAGKCDYLMARDADRRDADRMLRIIVLGCRFCGSNSMHGEVHTPECIYVTDPSARRVWQRQGARIIE